MALKDGLDADVHCLRNTLTLSSFGYPSHGVLPLRSRMNTSAPALTASSTMRRSRLLAASWMSVVPVASSR